ncbi:preprotein translocase subunit TatA [bacterium]|nr:preprotein translocase subunit TatA [bacterium]|tara:strand:- start:86 stop:763 length:678 start_codon:yes stop_codon:yes gene_type:complete
MLIAKYEYPTLQRKTQTNGKRQYVGDDSIPVPSVTTVLSETGDKTALINWRKRVGDAEATRISSEAAGLGTKVHNAIEKYILKEEWDTFGNNHVSVLAKTMTTMMVENGLTKIDELWGVEVGLIAAGLYAGTSDAIGVYEGEDAIIDFKTAKKIKKREWIEDYFMQGCAYALAHNEMMGTEIRKVVILMVDREGKFAEFTIKGEEFDEYCDKWAGRLADYYSKIS